MLPLYERIFLYKYLGQTIAKGISPKKALESYIEDIDLKKREYRQLQNAIFLLKGNDNLPVVLQKAHLMPQREAVLLSYTQEHTNFPLALQKLGDELRTKTQLKRKIKVLLFYPVILCIELFIIIILALFWLIPEMNFFFAALHIKSPTILYILTKAYQTIIEIISLYRFYWIIIMACVIWLIYQIAAIPTVLERLEHILIRLRAIGHLYKLMLTREFISSLKILKHQNKPLSPKELTIIAESTKNLIYKKALHHFASHIEKGGTISQFFKMRESKKLFPGIVRRMFILGEKNNNLSQEIKTLSDIITEEVELEVKHFISILEPMVIIGIAVFVLTIALMLQNVLGQIV